MAATRQIASARMGLITDGSLKNRLNLRARTSKVSAVDSWNISSVITHLIFLSGSSLPLRVSKLKLVLTRTLLVTLRITKRNQLIKN